MYFSVSNAIVRSVVIANGILHIFFVVTNHECVQKERKELAKREQKNQVASTVWSSACLLVFLFCDLVLLFLLLFLLLLFCFVFQNHLMLDFFLLFCFVLFSKIT